MTSLQVQVLTAGEAANQHQFLTIDGFKGAPLTDNFQVGVCSSLLNLSSGSSRAREGDLPDLGVRGHVSTGRASTIYNINYPWREACQGHDLGEPERLT